MTQNQWNQPPAGAPTGWQDPYAPQPAEQWSANDPYGQYSGSDMVPYQPTPQIPYGYAPPLGGQMDHPQSTVVFVLGLLSVIGFTILGPVAWLMGNSARKQVRERPEQYRAGGLLTAGWVMGIIGTAMMAFFVVYVVIAIMVVLGSY